MESLLPSLVKTKANLNKRQWSLWLQCDKVQAFSLQGTLNVGYLWSFLDSLVNNWVGDYYYIFLGLLILEC